MSQQELIQARTTPSSQVHIRKVSRTPTAVSQLSRDELTSIFKFLPFESLAGDASRVCRTWSAAAPLGAQRHETNRVFKPETLACLARSRFARHVGVLELSLDAFASDRELENLLRACKNLHALSLYTTNNREDSTPVDFSPLLSMHQLRRLVLDGAIVAKDGGVQLRQLVQLTHLHAKSLTYSQFQDLCTEPHVDGTQQLVSLQITFLACHYRHEVPTIAQEIRLLALLPALSQLYVGILTMAAVKQLGQLRHLQTCSFAFLECDRRGYYLTECVQAVCALGLRHLRWFEVCGVLYAYEKCRAVPTASLQQLLDNSPDLEYFSAEACRPSSCELWWNHATTPMCSATNVSFYIEPREHYNTLVIRRRHPK